VYPPEQNREFWLASRCVVSACVPFISGNLPDFLCKRHELTADNNNCVSFERMLLQIPAGEIWWHCVHTPLRVHRYVGAAGCISWSAQARL